MKKLKSKNIEKKPNDKIRSSVKVRFRYTLSTGDGFEVSLIDFGATIQSIRQADRNGQIGEVTLGYDDLQSKTETKLTSRTSFLVKVISTTRIVSVV